MSHIKNPYEGIQWKSAQRIGSANHLHLPGLPELLNGYRHGLRHFPISNYYPSAPYDADTRRSDFRLRQGWEARRDGRPLPPPIDWNAIITWADELEAPYRADFPFRETGRVYAGLPADAMLSPNAEHHGFSNSQAHICSPGSDFASGNFDVHGHYRLAQHGFPVGFGGTWQEGFRGMLQALRYPDGGGVVITHPTWFSRFSDEEVLEMLDFDDRVLGIEIYNDYSGRKDWFADPDYKAPGESKPGFSLNLWDRILSTGRRCWGFCVPDHSVRKDGDWLGRNILLVPAVTEHNCLRAYRQGQFYGCLKDNGLTIRDFTMTDTSVLVVINKPATIRFITGAGPAATVQGESAVYEFPHPDLSVSGKTGAPTPAYVRVEVEDDSGERLFLQPVMFERSYR